MKSLKVLLFGMGMSIATFAHANGYLNTDSFGIIEGDMGYGQLVGESATPWSAGAGYQWVVGSQMTAGVEGLYLYNGSVTQNQTSVKSQALAPFLSLYYYLTPHINIFAKAGYGYQENKYTVAGVTTNNNSWQPAGIGGVGYLLPFSKMVYLNIFADASWMNQNNSTAQSLVTNSGAVLRNTQYKVGFQLMF